MQNLLFIIISAFVLFLLGTVFFLVALPVLLAKSENKKRQQEEAEQRNEREIQATSLLDELTESKEKLQTHPIFQRILNFSDYSVRNTLAQNKGEPQTLTIECKHDRVSCVLIGRKLDYSEFTYASMGYQSLNQKKCVSLTLAIGDALIDKYKNNQDIFIRIDHDITSDTALYPKIMCHIKKKSDSALKEVQL